MYTYWILLFQDEENFFNEFFQIRLCQCLIDKEKDPCEVSWKF